MSRYTAYIISAEGSEQPAFGIVEDNGFSASVALPLSNGKSGVELLIIDPEVVRQFRKKHLGDTGNWDKGNPDDLKMEAYPVLMEAEKDPQAPAKRPRVEPIPVTVVPEGEAVEARDTRIGSEGFGDRFTKAPDTETEAEAQARKNRESLTVPAA